MNNSFNHKNPKHLLALTGTLFILAVIPITAYLVTRSEENARNPKAAAGRDPLKQPFASWSIWNLPIGSQAQRTPAGIRKAGGAMFVDQNIIIHSPDSPKVTVYFSSDRWNSGGSRCNRDNNTNIVGSFPLPASFIVPGNNSTNGTTPNSSAAILYKDGAGKLWYAQNQPIAHCTAGGDWTSGYRSSESSGPGDGQDAALDGPGRGGAQGGSSLSSVGGTIRVGELSPGGKIAHAMKYITDPANMSKSSTIGGTAGFRWPAFRPDSSFESDYNGTNPQVKMGSLLALPANFDVNSMQTVPGKIMAQAAKDYGFYIVDAGGDANTIATEQGTNGDVEKEFKNAYGYDFGKWGRRGIPWEADMDKILTGLDVITSWDQATYDRVKVSNQAGKSLEGAGGGTPVVPWAPEIGTITPPPTDTTPPIVSITSPTNGATNLSGTITFSASASDITGGSGMAKVVFYVDGTAVKTINAPGPYSFQYSTSLLTNAAHKFRATATDMAENPASNEVSASVNNVVVPPPPSAGLPSPWVTSDIGAVGVAGLASYNNGSFTENGSGSDIWGTSDSFRYLYQDLSGDGTVIARLTSQTNSDSWAKSGVMIRQDTTAGSAYAMLVSTPSNGLAFQYRSVAGGTSSHTAGGSLAYPVWLKLQKVGTTTTAFSSPNGITYTQVGSTTISFTSPAKVGLAVTSHNNTATSTAIFDNVSVSSTTTPPPTGSSFKADYFNNTTLIGTPVASSTINSSSLGFNWAGKSPATGVNTTNWSASFTGSFTFDAASYRFNATADDGVRIYVDGTKVLDGWKNQTATTYNAIKTMTAGTHTIKVEYYQNTSNDSLVLNWVHAKTCYDLTGDGLVDRSDLNIMADHFIQTGPSVAAWDLDGDQTISSLDLTKLAQTYLKRCS